MSQFKFFFNFYYFSVAIINFCIIDSNKIKTGSILISFNKMIYIYLYIYSLNF